MVSHYKGEVIVLFEKNVLRLGADADTQTTLDYLSASAIPFYSWDCVGGRLFSKEGGRRWALNAASGVVSGCSLME